MPEESKMAVDNDSLAKNKSTGNVRTTGNTLAQVAMLDGSVLDINIDVSIFIKLHLILAYSELLMMIYSDFIFCLKLNYSKLNFLGYVSNHIFEIFLEIQKIISGHNNVLAHIFVNSHIGFVLSLCKNLFQYFLILEKSKGKGTTGFGL